MRIRYPGLQNKQLDSDENANHDFIPGAWREGRNLVDTESYRLQHSFEGRKDAEESYQALGEFASRVSTMARKDDLNDEVLA